MRQIIHILLLSGLSVLFLSCGGKQNGDGNGQMLQVGDVAPDVAGKDQDGQSHTLSQTRGSFTVVYFYPKDQTPGCTEEACAFRDIWQDYEAAGIKLFGVSKNSAEDHKEFAKKYKLPFPLIVDESGEWGQAFGVSSMLGMYKRITFLLDKEGRIAKVYKKVDPGLHAKEILADIKTMSSN